MKLSIITVNYNNATELIKTISSVSEQNWADFEYIIIDGGSVDGSVDVIKSNTDKLAYWVSESDRGVFHAMNKGINIAKGEYLLMLNSGDLFCDKDALSRVFSSNPHTEDILTGDVYRAIEGKIFDKSYFPSNLTFDFFRHGSISHQSSFIKRSLHKSIGLYDENLRYSSDWKFFLLAICKHNFSYKHLPFFVSICDCGGLTSNANNFAAMTQESYEVIIEHFPAFIDDYMNYDKVRSRTIKNQLLNTWPRIKTILKRLI